MKKLALLLVSALTLFSATAQKKNFTYKFYGFVVTCFTTRVRIWLR